MAGLTKRKWMTITLAAVIVPISLLMAFKLTGIIPEPETPEIITLETVSWQMERPTYTQEMAQSIKLAYTDDETLVEIVMRISEYREDAPALPFADDDGVSFSVAVNSTHGSISSIVFRYNLLDENATIHFYEDFIDASNVTVISMKKTGTNTEEAYLRAQAFKSPCYIKSLAHWVFHDKNLEQHQSNVTVEVVYFNGTAYRKIVAPFHLQVWAPEAGEDFTSAKIIDPGNYLAYLDSGSDTIDYYMIWLEEGQTINVQVSYPDPYRTSDLDLYLYNSERELKASSCSTGLGVTESITFTVDSTGWWFIKIENLLGHSLYTLDVVKSSSESE